MALLAAALIAIGCGGGDGDSQDEPTTGVPVAEGRCKPEPEATEERNRQLESGELSQKQAALDEITEVRTCEVERNVLEFKEKICSAEIGEERLEGRIDANRAKQIAELKEKAGC
ncbi:MAG TPA: hypothetical protein VIT85_08210 [Solirubrobacterales bacterium]